MPKYLVTGGAGFIGSHIVQRLVRDGEPVRVLDDFSSGKRENLAAFDVTEIGPVSSAAPAPPARAPLPPAPAASTPADQPSASSAPPAAPVELLAGDLRSFEDCRRACDSIEVIFHQGAVPSVPKSVADPLTSHQANVDGTFNLLMAAKDAGCRRVIFAASSSAYGDLPDLPKRENTRPEPLSPYGANKLFGEYYCSVFSKCYGLETISLRYFNVFGPRQDPRSQYAAAIPAFVSAILHDEPPTVYGDGEQTRDFTYIDNVVHANLLAARAPRLRGEVVNIACGDRVTVNAIIAEINRLLDKNIQSRHVADRPGDVKHSLADISRARELLGYEPLVDFAEGLRRAIAWYRQNL